MAFTLNQLKELNSEDLIAKFLNLQTNYQSIVEENLKLKDTLFNLTERFNKLESVVQNLGDESANKDVSDQNKRIYEIEKQSHMTQQYTRRDTIEVVGIDTSIESESLEKKVCDIFGDIGVPTLPNDIQACHRLWDGKRTIVKFVNRKSANDILKKKAN